MGQAIQQAKQGDRVKINFTGMLEDGTLFDTTYESIGCDDDDCDCDEGGCGDDDCGCSGEVGPMELEVGSDAFFPQVEEALVGMAAGDKKISPSNLTMLLALTMRSRFLLFPVTSFPMMLIRRSVITSNCSTMMAKAWWLQ